MTRTASDPSEDNLSALWRAACNDYANETGITITDGNFPRLSGPEELSRQLDMEKDHFQDFRMKKRPLFHTMQMILAPFENWGDLIGGVVSAAFPPASSIMGAMLLLIRGARKVSESFDMITDLFQKLSNFALRLDTYKGVPLNEGMKIIIVKALINFLRVCAVSQKLLKTGSFRVRLSKWAKNIFVEDTSVASLLGELEELTSQEHKMISAQSLNLTHQALKNTADLLKRDDAKNDRERLDKVKSTLSPVSASSQVLSAISDSRIPGSGSWAEDRIRSWWQGSQPILWIHGGPGVGKSYLASKIINDLAHIEPSTAPTPVVASFFCKNNDVDLRSLNKGLRTLAWHVAIQLSSFAVHAEEFCLKEDPADTYVIWRKLLLNYFTEAISDVAACFVIDGIDEADPEEQEILFSLLEKTYAAEDQTKQTSPLRFVLLSRDSVRSSFEEHLLGWVPDIEITNNQNKDDLYGYVSQKLQRASLFRGSPDFLEEVVNGIRESAEGLWEWANLVIKSVLRCRTKGQIKQVVKTMPRGISAMLSQELQRLARELSAADALPDELSDGAFGVEETDGEAMITQIQQLNHILSFVTLAQKPLTVKQLELILEIIFEDEVLNLEDDIRTIYSSLFSLRPAEDEQKYFEDDVIVTLRHSSFYEFFKASGQSETGPIHVNPEQAEVTIVFVLLYALQTMRAPKSDKFLHPVREYSENFLPQHLTRASLEKACNLREKISALLADLFKDSGPNPCFISRIYDRAAFSYNFYPSSRVNEFGSYWFGAGDRDDANQRAQLVVDWLLPDSRQEFEDCARSSAVTSNACPFTVLFSPMVVSLGRHWLEPNEIETHDGDPWAISVMLNVYGEMAGTVEGTSYDQPPDDLGSSTIERDTTISQVAYSLSSYSILLVADLQKLQKTPIWHARLAQTLLLHGHVKDALDQFQISLDANGKSPTLSSQSLCVIHRDMGRACLEVGKFKEALKHSELAESLSRTGTMDDAVNGHIGQLLNTAQMRYLANMPDQAVATANEAWEAFIEGGDDRDWGLWSDFLAIFMELQQPQRLRPVFELAFSYFQEASRLGIQTDGLAEYIFEPTFQKPAILFSAIHFALTPDDGDYLETIASIVGSLGPSKWYSINLAQIKYLVGLALFEKGRVSTAIRSWYEAAIISNPPSDWYIKPDQERSLSHLVSVCLYHPEIPFCGEVPLALDEDAESGDICLVISSWLRDHGHLENARKALCGRVKKCIALLSDDDPCNDAEAYIKLFKTFLAATDSDEDLSGASYLIKAWRRTIGAEGPRDYIKIEALQKPGEEEWNGFWEPVDLRECANCRLVTTSASDWYFCRSCPHTALCGRCYCNISEDTTLSQYALGTCSPQHEFYYIGKPLRTSECLELGMVALTTPDGQIQSMWVEEWKDRLAEKWHTADFEFEGGLSAWCMRVLPEVQRKRWTTFFKV